MKEMLHTVEWQAPYLGVNVEIRHDYNVGRVQLKVVGNSRRGVAAGIDKLIQELKDARERIIRDAEGRS